MLAARENAKQSALVVGASRGVGHAIAVELLARGDRVFAASRTPASSAGLAALGDQYPSRLRTIEMDVTDEASVEAGARRVAAFTPRLHRVVVAAGVLHGPDLAPEKRLEQIDPECLLRSFAVNSIGPAVVAKHVLALLRHEDAAVFAALSARVGSIGDNRLGGWYGYRASKAAQNMLIKTLSIELKRRAPNLVCASLHPGTVETELSAPFSRSVRHRRFTPAEAARHLVDVIDSLRPDESGRFFAWDRKEIPW